MRSSMFVMAMSIFTVKGWKVCLMATGKGSRKPLASRVQMPDQKLRALISEILQTLPELQQKSVQHK